MMLSSSLYHWRKPSFSALKKYVFIYILWRLEKERSKKKLKSDISQRDAYDTQSIKDIHVKLKRVEIITFKK